MGSLYIMGIGFEQSKESLDEIICPGVSEKWTVAFVIGCCLIAISIILALIFSFIPGDDSKFETACIVFLSLAVALELALTVSAFCGSVYVENTFEPCVESAVQKSTRNYYSNPKSQQFWDGVHKKAAAVWESKAIGKKAKFPARVISEFTKLRKGAA